MVKRDGKYCVLDDNGKVIFSGPRRDCVRFKPEKKEEAPKKVAKKKQKKDGL